MVYQDEALRELPPDAQAGALPHLYGGVGGLAYESAYGFVCLAAEGDGEAADALGLVEGDGWGGGGRFRGVAG